MIEALTDLVRGGAAELPRRRRLVHDGTTVAIARIGRELVATIKGSFAPIFVWGRTDLPYLDPVDVLDGLNLYAAEQWPDLRPEGWLHDESNRERLRILGPTVGERLLVATNVIEFRGLPHDPALWSRRIEGLVSLARVMTAAKRPVPGLEELVALGLDRSFVERWAVSDDVDREEAIAAATDAELEDMLRVTAASWPSLEPLVRGERRNEPAGDLAGLLTDAAQEVEIELERRRGQPPVDTP